MRHLPPLGPLRAFEATVRLGSMTRAAADLGRTHGAVSRQIRALEEAVGVELIDRAVTPLAPTRAGAEFFAGVTAAFDTLERAMARLPGQRGTEQVRLACGSSFATRWVVPRLPRFYERYPGVAITFEMTSTSYQVARDYDVATTWDRLKTDPPRGPNVEVLADVNFAVVCRADYPVRLDGRRLEVATVIEAETAIGSHLRYADRAGVEIVTERSMTLPHMHLCIEAVIGGLGATLVETRLVQEELGNGRLVAPLGILTIRDGFLAVHNPARPVGSAQRKLVAWLRRELGPDALPPAARGEGEAVLRG